MAPGRVREVGHHVGERVEMLGARPARRDPSRRPDLGVHAEHPSHLGDEFRQRVREMSAQRGEFATQSR